MEINYIKLGVTLFLALTLSSLVVDGIETYFAGQVIKELAQKAKVENKKREHDRISQAQQRRLNEIDAHNEKIRLSKKNKSEALKRSSIIKTNNDTCSYWTKEYSKSRTEYNDQMKKAACRRARND